MKKFILSLVCSTIFALKLAAAVAATGDMAPNIQSPVWLDGKVYRLAEYKNKKDVVLFIWSPDQRALAEFQNMNRIAKQCANDKTVFLSIGNANAEILKKFPGVNKLNFPVCADHNRATANLYVRSFDRLPLAVVINKEGKICWRGSIRQVPAVLNQLRAGKFDLAERVRTEKFSFDVSEAIKAKKFDEANKLIYAEWEKHPTNKELIGMYILIAGRHLKRYDDAFKMLALAHQKNPGSWEIGEMEFQLICGSGQYKKLDEFNKRMIAVHGKDPAVMIKFASMFARLPVKEMQITQIHSFLSSGWRNGKFKDDAEKAAYAIEYAKLMHTFGRADIALKLAMFAEQKSTGKAKEGARDAAAYYKKIIANSAKLDL